MANNGTSSIIRQDAVKPSPITRRREIDMPEGHGIGMDGLPVRRDVQAGGRFHHVGAVGQAGDVQTKGVRLDRLQAQTRGPAQSAEQCCSSRGT
jgi:hypothetical protein